MSAFTIPSIFIAVDKMSAPVKKMSRNMTTFAQKAEIGVARLDRRMRRLTPSIGGVGKQMIGLAATGALVAGVGSAIRTIKDFEQANADLNARLGNATLPQLKLLSTDASRLGGITAKTATEVVGLQEAFASLGFQTPDILNMTESTIAGSIAMNAELSETAELVGAVIKTFGDLKSTDTTQVIDQMTLATQKSALKFEKLQTSLPIVAGAANAAGIGFEELLSLLGKLSDAGIDASMSANSLKNIFIESKAKSLDYGQILDKIKNSQDKLTFANTEFGKRAAVSGTILADNIDELKILQTTLESARKGQLLSGAAQEAADKRLNTLAGSLTLLSSKWDSIVLKQNENTGAIGIMNRAVKFLTDNLETIAGTILTLAGVWLGLKVILFATRTALIAYNIWLGVSSALSTTAAIAVGGNATALAAYSVATKTATFFVKLFRGAQLLLNIALNANPIGILIISLIALIGFITLVVKKYDTWGAAMTTAMGPLGDLISLVVEFKRAWGDIQKAFSTGGIKSAIKEIGKVILKSIINPIQQVFELWGKLPGKMGEIGDMGVALMQGIKGGLGIEAIPALNPKKAEQEALSQKIEETKTTNAVFTVNAPKGLVDIKKDDDFPYLSGTYNGVSN